MKRISAILFIFTLIFLFSACGSKTDGETTTAPTPVIEEAVYTRDFKNSDGKVVIKVDVTLPQISDKCDEAVTAYINGVALKIFNDACDFAESNIENASNYMTNFKSDVPWSKTVTFKTTLLDSRFACFIIQDALSYGGGKAKPTWSTKCFDVKTGKECTMNDFSVYKENPHTGFEVFLSDLVSVEFPKRFEFPQFIDDSVMERLDEIFVYDDFYLTENGMGFYIDTGLIHEYLGEISTIEFTWDELASMYEIDMVDFVE